MHVSSAHAVRYCERNTRRHANVHARGANRSPHAMASLRKRLHAAATIDRLSARGRFAPIRYYPCSFPFEPVQACAPDCAPRSGLPRCESLSMH
eukprot:3281444-Pleurochrysis_carterae.AAC.1